LEQSKRVRVNKWMTVNEIGSLIGFCSKGEVSDINLGVDCIHIKFFNKQKKDQVQNWNGFKDFSKIGIEKTQKDIDNKDGKEEMSLEDMQLLDPVAYEEKLSLGEIEDVRF